ncbi:AAA family ATPase [Poseidonocella sp. HB161398]|uniref:AAA family ATPase n=1 Tax=Poseidonocella sp. HB161398 TaxID=2320855 RepID=UPI001108A1CE|nr:AAA family ATPase [Poseidonocella sp. HB161398]
MEKLCINLFGVFSARAGGVPLRMPTRRAELVLALLALSPGKAVSRAHLAALLWPGQEDAQARASLRQAIFRLRGALGDAHAPAIESTAVWLKLRPEAVALDADALAAGEDADLPEGLPLDGLSGFEPEIEDLLDTARADLRRRLAEGLAAASARAAGDRRYADLESLARRRLALEPYDEAALRDQMTALWRQGQRNAALTAFRDISQRIRNDLSVAVEPETQALYQAIRASVTRPPPAEAAPSPGSAPRETEVPLSAAAEPDAAAVAQPAHLRLLAVVHVASERLRAALRDPDPESAEAGSLAVIAGIEAAVSREGGELIGRAGHHLSAVFGASRPDESPALSAALAAFEIAGRDCAVGIHAGPGLVGLRSGTFPLVHLAQSLAGLAVPGEVRITAEIEAACRGAFEMHRAGALADEGGGEGIPTWRLGRETAGRGGFDIRRARGLSRFCGRVAELEKLGEVARQQTPRIAVVTGEPGIGKSRLVHEFLGQSRPGTVLRVQLAPGETGGGLARFAAILRGLAAAGPDLPAGQLLDRLTEGWEAPGPAASLRPALAAVLDEREEMRPWLGRPRNQRMQALADALLTAVEVLAGRQAILLVEDAHWADEDAGLLLERLALSLHAAGPMMIVTRRTGAAAAWQGHETVLNLALRALERSEAAALLDTLDLPGTARPAVLARGAGVPLFLEELSRAAAADAALFGGPGADSPPDAPLREMPVPLRGILSHRIDALPGHARQVLDAASVLGAEPDDSSLAALCGLPRDVYDMAVSVLADADLLYRIRTYPRRSYAFKHALIQDAAYHGIPGRRRAELHAAVIAVHDQAGTADMADEAALARHALEGGLPDRAVGFAMQAARSATERSAYALSGRMTDIALEAVSKCRPGEDMLRLEAEILTWRRALLWPLGQKAKTVEGLERAEAIARDLGDDLMLAEVCIHRAYIHSDDGNAGTGLDYSEKAAAAAARAGDRRLAAEAALARCQIFSLQGRMRAARDAIGGHAGAWDGRRHALDGLLVTRYVMLQFHLARISGALGDGGGACAHIGKAVRTAVETARPVDRYIACRVIGDVCALAGAHDLAHRAFAASRDIAARAELPAYVTWAEAEIAEIELDSGHRETAAATLRRFLDSSGRALLRIAQIKAQAALACAMPGEGAAGMASLEAALAEAEAAALPLVRIKLLNAMSARLAESGSGQAAALARMADGISAAEGYRQAVPPSARQVEAWVRMLAEAV